jgi:hypothetical protein
VNLGGGGASDSDTETTLIIRDEIMEKQPKAPYMADMQYADACPRIPVS